MNIDIHKNKAQTTVILRCWKCSHLHWFKSYNIKHKFITFSPVANLMYHPLHIDELTEQLNVCACQKLIENMKGSLLRWMVNYSRLFQQICKKSNDKSELGQNNQIGRYFKYLQFVIWAPVGSPLKSKDTSKNLPWKKNISFI